MSEPKHGGTNNAPDETKIANNQGEMAMIRAIFFTLLFFFCMTVYGMPGKVHVRDCQGVFNGLQGNNLREAYKVVSKGIDYDFYQRIGQKFGYPPENHRILGHWGFEGNIPFNKEPWKSALAEYPKDEIIHIWQNYNTGLVKRVAKLTGLGRHQAKGLTGIIYNTHLLGDLVEGNVRTDLIYPVDNISKDIEKNLHRLLGNNSNEAKIVISKMRALPRTMPQADKAAQVLDILQESCIDEKMFQLYGRQLSRKGISRSRELLATARCRPLLAKGTVTRLGQTPVNNLQMEKELLRHSNPNARCDKRIICKGWLTPKGNLCLAMQAGAQAGLMTFAADASIATFRYIKGDTWPMEFRQELEYAALRGAVVGGCVAVSVVLGAAPGGWIVLAVGIGAYVVTDLAIKMWECHLDKQYLTMEDLKAFGIAPNTILHPNNTILRQANDTILKAGKDSIIGSFSI